MIRLVLLAALAFAVLTVLVTVGTSDGVLLRADDSVSDVAVAAAETNGTTTRVAQTVEAINHAKAADVPIVVAINKIDREEADPNRVRQALSEHGLVPEEWGGDTIMVEVSALQNLGVDDILEQLLVVAL